MTPQQKIKHLILLKDVEMGGEALPVIDQSNIDEVFDARGEEWRLQDATEEVRPGEFRTRLKTEWSRHYESDAAAARYIDGSFVGWTYWHGGGKHGEPESIPWIEDAYEVACQEEEKLVVVRTFSLSASVDTLPKGQDAKQGLAGTEGSAVPEGQTPRQLPPNTGGSHG